MSNHKQKDVTRFIAGRVLWLNDCEADAFQ